MSDSVTGSAGRFLVAGLVSMGQDVEGAINAVSDAQREAVDPWRRAVAALPECLNHDDCAINKARALLEGHTDE